MTPVDIANTLNLDGADIAGRHWRIFGCSAMTGQGLESGIDWIVSDVASRIFLMT